MSCHAPQATFPFFPWESWSSENLFVSFPYPESTLRFFRWNHHYFTSFSDPSFFSANRTLLLRLVCFLQSFSFPLLAPRSSGVLLSLTPLLSHAPRISSCATDTPSSFILISVSYFHDHKTMVLAMSVYISLKDLRFTSKVHSPNPSSI